MLFPRPNGQVRGARQNAIISRDYEAPILLSVGHTSWATYGSNSQGHFRLQLDLSRATCGSNWTHWQFPDLALQHTDVLSSFSIDSCIDTNIWLVNTLMSFPSFSIDSTH